MNIEPSYAFVYTFVDKRCIFLSGFAGVCVELQKLKSKKYPKKKSKYSQKSFKAQ